MTSAQAGNSRLAMNNELAQREPLEVQAKRAELMAGAGEVLPRTYRNNPAALLVAFEYADALGIPRVNALTSIHLVDGKPTASADLIGALVRRAGHKLRVTGDETYAEAVIIRADDPDFIPAPIRWDEQRARKAGLWGKKGPWQNYPGAMMRSRAITEAARMWASDALYGVIYTPEEMGARVSVEGEVIDSPATSAPPRPEARRTPEPAAPEPDWDELTDWVAASVDVDELREAWKSAAKWKTDRAAEVCRLITERVKTVQAAPEPASSDQLPDDVFDAMVPDDDVQGDLLDVETVAE